MVLLPQNSESGSASKRLTIEFSQPFLFGRSELNVFDTLSSEETEILEESRI